MKLALENRIPPVAVTLVVAVIMWLMSLLAPAMPLPEKLRLALTVVFAAAAAVVPSMVLLSTLITQILI